MSKSNTAVAESESRPVGGSQYSWCRAVPGGTGIAVLALLLSKPIDASRLQAALHRLQHRHPILRSKLQSNTAKNTFSFLTFPTPSVQIKSLNLSLTSKILNTFSNPNNYYISPVHVILEHELNQNSWCNYENIFFASTDMFFASIYALSDTDSVAVFRLHVAACDRTTAASLLRELLVMVADEEEGGKGSEMGIKVEEIVGIEDLVPSEKGKKPLWARAVNVINYSVNSLRLSNLKFRNVRSSRSSEMVRLQLNLDDTQKLLDGCKARGIKLCGALTAAGLIAVHSSKHCPEPQKKKYGVITFIDCRTILDPPLSTHHFGFYHSAILNIHAMKGGENLWDVAQKTYTTLANSKDCNKHLSDMADLNFLMCKAIENPSLTSSSSLRTSFLSVFEDSVIDNSNDLQREVGIEDYVGCASVHGIGPSIAVFDTVRDGKLDCVCVYPSPLHSRDQMLELVANMKCVLRDGRSYVE